MLYFEVVRSSNLANTFYDLFRQAYIDGSCFVDRINCNLVIPINRQMQSDGVSDFYFDVALTLSK